jgi:hypothetical protein
MTESEWLMGNIPYFLYQHIRLKADQRKLRLFACACCRRIWQLLPDRRSRLAVEVSDRYADDRATKEELSTAQAGAAEALREAVERCRPLEVVAFKGFEGLTAEEKAAAEAQWLSAARRREAAKAAKAVARSTSRATTIAEEMGQAAGWALSAELIGRSGSGPHAYYSDLLRCVFGNPFRPAQIAARLTPDVIRLAEAIYDEQSFDDLPVLAGALEDAGCSDSYAVAHCRGPSPHGRGCWVLDSILRRG